MEPAQPTPLAELVKSLAGLHQTQHQALIYMKLEQEDRFRVLVQAQDEDRRVLRSLLGRKGIPVAAPSIAHVPLMKMGPQDDPEAFVDLFEKTAKACGWARTQWSVRLIPLPGRLPQVAHGRATRRRGSSRSGGAGAVHRSVTPWNGRVGQVSLPDVADAGHTADGGPSSDVPRGWRAPY